MSLKEKCQKEGMRYSSICRSLAGDTGYVSAESSIESDDEKELNHILEPQHAGK